MASTWREGGSAQAVLSSPTESYYTAPRPLSLLSYSTAPSPHHLALESHRRAKALLPQPKQSLPRQQQASSEPSTTGRSAHPKRIARGSFQPWGQPHHHSHEARRHAAGARVSSNEAQGRRDRFTLGSALPEERRERERGPALIEARQEKGEEEALV